MIRVLDLFFLKTRTLIMILFRSILQCKPTWAMSIHFSMIAALSSWWRSGCLRTVAITLYDTALNWLIVAYTLGAFAFFFSLRDHTEPRQWWGTTFLNNSCNNNGLIYFSVDIIRRFKNLLLRSPSTSKIDLQAYHVHVCELFRKNLIWHKFEFDWTG